MSKVTSKLQVTISKAHGIEPGTEILFESAGDSIRVHRMQEEAVEHGSGEEGANFPLRLFDEATGRQRAREEARQACSGIVTNVADRGWAREELYRRAYGAVRVENPFR